MEKFKRMYYNLSRLVKENKLKYLHNKRGKYGILRFYKEK